VTDANELKQQNLQSIILAQGGSNFDVTLCRPKGLKKNTH
jgi:hypothetical protein